ncbi:hypothetical protein [Winogradskyella sp.]|uniref:hypothetical protein n=1 Tax=Winogradskyella sp. TaxID=1883156 RepID=UPI002620B762|nr:hypothetical protein [Winogradskyella sp.]
MHKSNTSMDDVLNSKLLVYQISGFDGPKVNINNDSLAQFLTSLYYNVPLTDIETALQWDSETTLNNIDVLIENKLLSKRGDYYQPTLGILTLERGQLLKEEAQKVANIIADSIIKSLPKIQKIHDQTNISNYHDFKELSFFYLSNVLLDNFQIQAMEEGFLNKPRPMRNGSRYYIAIVEDYTDNKTEPYGIYGNQGLFWNDSIGISVYGNKRVKSNVGWDNYEDKEVYVFDKDDTPLVTEKMPTAFLPTLLDLLNDNKSNFESTYQKLNFDKEVTFEEFFIFYYHFVYTVATDILIEKDIIIKPQNSLFYYQIAHKVQ